MPLLFTYAAAHWARVRNGLSIKSDDVSAGQLNFWMTGIGVTSHHCTSAIRLPSYKRINESHKFTWRSFKCHRSHIIYSIMQMKWNTPSLLTSNAAISSCDLHSLSFLHRRIHIHIRRLIYMLLLLVRICMIDGRVLGSLEHHQRLNCCVSSIWFFLGSIWREWKNRMRAPSWSRMHNVFFFFAWMRFSNILIESNENGIHYILHLF